MTFFSFSEMTRLRRCGSGEHTVDRFLELVHADLGPVEASGEQRGLVDDVRQIGTGEARGPSSEHLDVDLFRERLAARVHLEDPDAAVEVGTVDDDLTVETSGTQQSRVEDVGPVRRRDQDHAALHVETVHLDEQLVQGLLALVVSTAETGAAVTTDGVDLVHEDDRRSVRLRLLEEVAHAAGADADEHLDEVGTRDREERNAGLAGDGAGEQRLAGSRGAEEKDALGDLGPHRLELLGRLEVLLDLLELLDRLVETGDVGERDLRLVLGDEPGLRLAEATSPGCRHPASAA